MFNTPPFFSREFLQLQACRFKSDPRCELLTESAVDRVDGVQAVVVVFTNHKNVGTACVNTDVQLRKLLLSERRFVLTALVWVNV